jgi:hypothetical protein
MLNEKFLLLLLINISCILIHYYKMFNFKDKLFKLKFIFKLL